ncbi:hypothetical protein [Nocardioides panaciterrulae]|uniref:Tetratricopeptide (TPR) repeat protein n=1 Tax=Nocardioides panaciterrulae TaxID=661492 RepID=A0A7Y9JAR2_9ACTN|nr:hypothetical protein [Nocardioides panaciterrulae]NYD41992.1 tetratricopeptide (TPR) repeat protein [Nocardioides panaciterrulae]
MADTSSYELDGALAALVGKGVLEVQGEPLAAEPGAYRFVQAMVRDVAYGTLARADRRARHLAAADHLEHEVGEGGGAPAGIVARHLLDALAAGRPGDPDRGRLVDRARGLLVMAAARSETLGSADEALRSTLAALDLEPVGLEATQLRERAARVAMLAGKHSLGEGLAAQAVAGYRERDDVEDLVRALALHARLALRLGRAREAGELAGQGHAMLREREVDPERALPLACELLRTMASAARISGDRASQQRYTLEALSLAEELQDPAVLHRALTSLSTMLLDSGSRSGHQAVTERCLVKAREAHLLEPLSDSLINLTSETYAQDLAGASERAEESVSVARQLGNSDATEVALTNACFTWWLNGDWDRLLAETGEWFEDREVTASSGSLWLSRAQVQLARGEPVDVPDIPPSEDPYDQQTAAVSLALRAAWRGEVADAAAALEREQRSLQAVELEDFEMIWAPGVELQLHAGNVDAASRLLQLAEPVAGRRGRPLTRALLPRLRGLVAAARGEDPEADLREAVAALEAYGARYLLARTRLDLGRWLVARDRTGEADPLLAEARAVFVDLRALPSVAEVDALERPRAAGRPAPTPSAR